MSMWLALFVFVGVCVLVVWVGIFVCVFVGVVMVVWPGYVFCGSGWLFLVVNSCDFVVGLCGFLYLCLCVGVLCWV